MLALDLAQETHASLRYLQAFKATHPAERRLNQRIGGLFDKVITETVRELERVGRVPGDILLQKIVTGAFDVHGPAISGALSEGALDQAQSSRIRLLQEAGLYAQFRDRVELPNQIYDLIKNHSFEASQYTLTRMRDDVMGNLAKSYEEGLGIDDAANRLRDKFQGMRDYELERIARTEIQSGQNMGAYETEREFHINYHMWWSADDDRVRDGTTSDADHTYMHGQIVRVGEPFSNGLLYPGDMSGPIEEWINCRCRIVPFLMPEGMMAPNADFFYEEDLVPIPVEPEPV